MRGFLKREIGNFSAFQNAVNILRSPTVAFGWWIKVTGLPLMYWNYMLKGHVWFPKHNTGFKGDVV